MATKYYYFTQAVAGMANDGDVLLLTETAQLDNMVANGLCIVVSGPAAPAVPSIGAVAFSNQQSMDGATARALRRFHAQLGARNVAGSAGVKGGCDIGFLTGDSLIASQGATTQANGLARKFASYMRTAFPQTAVGGLGYLDPFVPISGPAPSGFPDAVQTTVNAGVLSPTTHVPGYGPGSASVGLTTSVAQNIQWAIGAGAGVTDFDIYVFATGAVAGSATVTVDGTVYGSYNSGTGVLSAGAGTIACAQGTGPTGLIANQILRIRGLSVGAHTIKVTWASGTYYVSGAFAYNGDVNQGVRVLAAGYGGRGSRNFVGTAYGAAATNPYAPGNQSEQWLQPIVQGFWLPDLLFVSNFANDYAGTATDLCSTTENLANLQSIIAKIKAACVLGAAAQGLPSYVPSFVTAPPHCIVTSNVGGPSGNGGTMVDVWQNYVANAYTLAAADPDGAVVPFDLGQRLQGSSNTWDNVTYNGLLWTDHVHPADAGNDWWARALVDFVRPK